MGKDQQRRGTADSSALNPPLHGAGKLDRQRLGRDAEAAAERFLTDHAHRILLRNHRCRMGELDLVACDDTRAPEHVVLVIAEVRLRSRQDFGGGAASVTHHKQRRLLHATRHLLAMYPQLSRLPIRFDVLDLAPDAQGYRIEWIRHAFSV
jgi:putative endonuclease